MQSPPLLSVSMIVNCPHCRHAIEVSENLINKVADCPSCSRRFVVKRPVTAAVQSRRGFGFVSFFLLALLIAAGSLAFACWKQQATPADLVRRLIERFNSAPAGETPSPSVPLAEIPPHLVPPGDEPDEPLIPLPPATVPVAPTEMAAEQVPPTPASEPAQPIDPRVWLTANPLLRPSQVALTLQVRFALKTDGKVVGSVLAPVGTLVDVLDLKDPDVSVSYRGVSRLIPIDATDLLDRTRAEIKRRETLTQLAVERTTVRREVSSAAALALATRKALPAPDPLGRIQLTAESQPPYRTVPFVHPGALHTEEDLKRMATRIASGQQPWKETWDLLQSSNLNVGRRPRPFSQVIRGVPGNNYTPTQLDANTAYQCALRYRLTGDTAQADHAVAILKAWSVTMKKGVGGNSNFALGAGIIGYEFACAGELLRDYPGWKKSDFDAYKNFLRLFLAGNRDFLVRRNGTGGTHYRLNWDTCNLLSMISIAVVLDEPATFDEAVTYFLRGIGNGNIDRAIWYVHPDGSGQTEEMGRDQPHNSSGLEWMALFCQVAWNQGIDLYGYDNNRLLRGFEYVARYNLGHDDVPYAPHTTYKMNYVENPVSPSGRGIPPRYELVYNHYVNRRGLAAPFVEEAALKTRPVGGPAGHPSAYDFFGFTTLTYTLPPIEKGAPPSGLRAVRSERQIDLSWWGSAKAKTYLIKRASGDTAPFATIATIDAAEKKTNYTDTHPDADSFRYQIVAIDSSGRELAGDPLTVRKQLIAHFTLDNTLAEAGGPRIAAHSGTPAYGPGPMPGTQALVFNGESDFLRLPREVADTRDITIATWVFWNGGGAYQRIFDIGGDITKSLWLSPDAGGKLRFMITTTRGMDPGTSTLDAAVLPANRWVHLAVTLSGDTGTLYVNGQSVASGPVALDPLFTQNNDYLGKSQYADPLFKGKLADFRIYKYALAPADIAALHQLRR
ncbi:MAG TPA: LamG-like jellyroll fold domain-containing protein [Rariglobus sp.]|nr:LamG-like jellyroll fold domain-containing protein [Rariglobus sp.]